MGSGHPPGVGHRAGLLPLTRDRALQPGLFAPTYRVSELTQEIRDLLAEAFPSVWIVGEVNRLRVSARGHAYFEMVEKGRGDEIIGKLDAVIWRTDLQRLRRVLAESGQELAEGFEIRCRGSVDFYPPAGRLQMVVREIDPVFSLGLLARRRQETLAALAAANLLEKNRQLALSDLPLDLALITSEGSAAYHDFLSTLRESGYGFRVLLLHAAVQGKSAERELASALKALEGLPVSCAALIRGGGSRSDLATFDSRTVAEAVARAPVPVLAGLGHEIDQSVADLVAHTSLKTPTKVAELLVHRVAESEREWEGLHQALVQAAGDRLRDGREALSKAHRVARHAHLRLDLVAARIEEAARSLGRSAGVRLRGSRERQDEVRRRLAAAAPRRIDRDRSEPKHLGERLAAAARGRLREVEATLRGIERLSRQLSPERTLERGYSITRAESGRIVRHWEQLEAGQRLHTRLAQGAVVSRVEQAQAEDGGAKG